MSIQPLTPSRRVTRRHLMTGAAILTITAAVLATALTSQDSASAAGTQVPAAITSGSTTTFSSTDSATTSASTSAAAVASEQTAPMALIETSAAAVQATTEQAAVAPSTATEASAEPTTAAAQPVSSAPLSAEALITGRTMYATEPVNVRTAPGTDGTSVVGTLSSLQQVTAGDSVDGWVPVHADDYYGWVTSSYLADGAAPEPVTAAAAAAPSAEAVESSGNWMEELISQVDPNGQATWVFSRNGGWGASNGHTIYIDPNVPSDKHFSVMVHEYSHVLQVQVYGSLRNSVAAMNAITGGSGVSANEQTADCMAIILGASWINYGCPDSLRGAAAAIVAGQRA